MKLHCQRYLVIIAITNWYQMGFTLITIIIRYWLNSIEILGTFFCHSVSVTSIKLYPIVAMLHIFRKKNIRRVDKDLYYVYVKCIAKLTMYFISSNVGAIFFFLKRFFFLHFRLSSITTNPMEMMTRLKKINCQNCKRTIFFQHMKV